MLASESDIYQIKNFGQRSSVFDKKKYILIVWSQKQHWAADAGNCKWVTEACGQRRTKWVTANPAHGQTAGTESGSPKSRKKSLEKKNSSICKKKYKMATNFTTSKEPKKEKLQFRPALIFVTIEILRSKS